MKKNLLNAAFFLLVGAVLNEQVMADSAVQKLQEFFLNTTSMSAEFTQSIVSETKPSKEKSGGVLKMQRPGKFRWDYSFPFKQQIVADGSQLWVYDVEMEQVIVKPLDLVLGNTPAVLLSGNANIADRFDVVEITEKPSTDKGLYWMQLTPKQEESGFEKLLLAFRGSDLSVMELKDAFGQVTRIEFSRLVKNPKIDPSEFIFRIPKGVDVIRDSEAAPQ